MIEKQMVRRGRKFQQVCEGAREIFLRDGYEGASVDDISRAAGVSKATLYNYFPHKELIFKQILENEIDRAEQQQARIAGSDLPPEQGLAAILQALARDAVSEVQTAAFRLSIAEARHFPRQARSYHDRVLSRRGAVLVAYLEHWVAQEALRIADIQMAADHLWQLTAGMLSQRAALLPDDDIDDAMIARTCARVVGPFLRVCAPANSLRHAQ